MKKIIVIGCPGSGKSTFARVLHEATAIPLVHLDMLYWNADRTTVPKPVFLQRLQDAIAQETWIIDGNYGSTMEMRLQAADTVFFLDYSTEICLAGIEARKGKPRADLPWIEPADDPEDTEFTEYVKTFYETNRPSILELVARFPEKNVIVFHERMEAEKFLRNLYTKNT